MNVIRFFLIGDRIWKQERTLKLQIRTYLSEVFSTFHPEYHVTKLSITLKLRKEVQHRLQMIPRV